MKWWVIGESNSAGVLLQSRPLPEPHPDCDEWGEPAGDRPCFPYSPRNWRPARESNPSHSMDSRTASSDASQTLRDDALLERRRLAAVSAATHAGAAACCCAVRAQDAAEGRCVPRRRDAAAPRDVIRIGASGPTRTDTVCALDALPLPIGVQTHRRSGCKIRLEDQVGGPGWIQTNAGLTPGRLRGGCRRSLGYWSGIRRLGYWRTRWDSHPR
jgi:hypothetical protein